MNDTSAFDMVNFGLLIVLLGVAAWTFHKVRLAHILTHQTKADVRVIQAEVLTLYRQLEAYAALQHTLTLPTPLHSLRHWAGSPDFLLTISQIILQTSPRVVVECSSGASTVVIARCLEILGEGHVYSLEHDEKYARKTRALLQQNGLLPWATVVNAPLKAAEDGGSWYDLENLPNSATAIDLLVIDGPPHDTAPLARLPALPMLSSRLSEAATIILDDAARDAEKAIIRRWREYDSSFEGLTLRHEKGCYVLTRNPAALDIV